MSTGGRKGLVWDIRKSLLTMSTEELHRVGKALDPALDEGQSEQDDQELYYDHINSFMYNKRLLESEDEGMVQLLMLKDVIDDIVKCHENDTLLLDVKSDSAPHAEQNGETFVDLTNFSDTV